MIVEIKDESILWFIKKPRGTINLLNVVLAVANDTPYTLASLRRECVRDGDCNKDEVLCSLHFLL